MRRLVVSRFRAISILFHAPFLCCPNVMTAFLSRLNVLYHFTDSTFENRLTAPFDCTLTAVKFDDYLM